MTPIASLGYFVFMVETAVYSELQRSTEYKWSSNERVGNMAAHQFLGPGTDDLTLPGYIVPEVCGSQSTLSLDAIRMVAATGQPQQFLLMRLDSLVTDIIGKWIIDRVEETQTEFFGAYPQRIDFVIKLRRYEPSKRLIETVINALF